MRKYLVAALSAALLTTTALAADKAGPVDLPLMPAPVVSPSCYVQALAGSSINTVEVEGAGLPLSISASGWTVGAGVGCDVKIERIVLGAFARVELPVDQETSFVDADHAWTVGGRLGYMLNTGLMAYGLVGYTQSDWRVDIANLSKDGLVLGGGLEVMLAKNLTLTAEYTRTGMDSTEVGGMAFKPVTHGARLGIAYRFNSFFGE